MMDPYEIDWWAVAATLFYCCGVLGQATAVLAAHREGTDADGVPLDFFMPKGLEVFVDVVECALWPVGVILNAIEAVRHG